MGAFLILFSFEEADTHRFPITGLTAHWYEAMTPVPTTSLGMIGIAKRPAGSRRLADQHGW